MTNTKATNDKHLKNGWKFKRAEVDKCKKLS